jgi:hypothetical protein
MPTKQKRRYKPKISYRACNLVRNLPGASPQKQAAIEAGYSPKKASQIRLLGFEPYPRLSGRDYGPTRALQTVVGFVETVQNLLIAER